MAAVNPILFRFTVEEVEVPNYEPILYGGAAPAGKVSTPKAKKPQLSPKLPKLNEGMKKPLVRTISNKPQVRKKRQYEIYRQ